MPGEAAIPIGAHTPAPGSPLREAQDRFIAAWGRMAGAWGISRTMAEAQALLYISGRPMCTDDIMDRLQISRGNASMSLRALLEWGIVSRTHRRGDRKEYFQAEGDVWAMFRAIVRERVKREVDPLLASLHEIRDLTRDAGTDGRARSGAARQEIGEHNARLDAMLDFFTMLETLGHRFISPAGPGLRIAARILSSPLASPFGKEAPAKRRPRASTPPRPETPA